MAIKNLQPAACPLLNVGKRSVGRPAARWTDEPTIWIKWLAADGCGLTKTRIDGAPSILVGFKVGVTGQYNYDCLFPITQLNWLSFFVLNMSTILIYFYVFLKLLKYLINVLSLTSTTCKLLIKTVYWRKTNQRTYSHMCAMS